MATLKNLLDSTLTSFLNSKKVWSTNQVMPSATSITITPETVPNISESYFRFVASYDGWISLSGSANTADKPTFYVAQRVVGGGITGASFGYLLISFPVRAGQTVYFWADDITNLTVLLYRAVSGT